MKCDECHKTLTEKGYSHVCINKKCSFYLIEII